MVYSLSHALLLVIFLVPYALANNNVEECKSKLWGQHDYCKKYYAPPKTITVYETYTKTKWPQTYTVTSTDKQWKTVTKTRTSFEKIFTTPTITKQVQVYTTQYDKQSTTLFKTWYKTFYAYSTYYITQTETVKGGQWGYQHPRAEPTPHMLAVRGGSYNSIEKEYDWETIKQACYEIYYPQEKTVTYKKYTYTRPPPVTSTSTVTVYYKTTSFTTDYQKETITAAPYIVKDYQTSTITKTSTYTDVQKVEKDTTIYKKKWKTTTVTVTASPTPTWKKEKHHWGRDVAEIEAKK